ncbi:interleukin-10 receptor subunit beta isoform X1 [Alligator mississippiensis]|uniref:interleukin-10 receptor subunit beta isoform X1 n=1 Tax=Alligator mississippiensis TaxID=8496 RepID=UPI0028772E50|nr:interleukin-10 receptor subunit beta isoform X1 [Alligator mississippiensis]
MAPPGPGGGRGCPAWRPGTCPGQARPGPRCSGGARLEPAAMARLLLLLLPGLLCAFAMVPELKNVRINSVNFRSKLQWDPPTFHKGNITYTVQHKSSYKNTFENLCTSIDTTECDISFLSIYGNFTVRVMAESENELLGLADIIFNPMEDTIIGPPAVKVRSESGYLTVDFTGPASENSRENWTVQQYYGSSFYRVQYWKKGSAQKVITVNSSHNSASLLDLDPWTVYCLQVQAVVPEWNKVGEFSQVLCEKTTENGITPVWMVVAVLLISMLVVLVSVPACFFSFLCIYRQTRYIFYPSYSFPQHLKEFLSKPSYSSQFCAPQSPEEDHSYDKLTVISEESENCSGETENQSSNTEEQVQSSHQEISDSEVPDLKEDQVQTSYLIQPVN